MRRVLFLLLSGLLITGQSALAVIMDLEDVNGVGYFYDTDTGYTWLDVDVFVGLSYNDVEQQLQGTQFHIASLNELQIMQNNALLQLTTDFGSLASIMGSIEEQGLYYIQGLYDTQVSGQYGVSWGGLGYQEWAYAGVIETPVYASEFSNRDYVWTTAGAWVVSTPTKVPEPASLILLVASLAAFGACRKRF